MSKNKSNFHSAEKEVETHLEHQFEMLDLGRFARKMGVCPNTVRNWIERGKLVAGDHFFQDGKYYGFPWGPELIAKLMKYWHPAPQPPRPKLKSKKGGNRQLYRLKA